ncbi:hypothetical protein J5N97_018002 [Dioscorea zingiberensis]|uniref:Uncharacterized protein n=1 Tax=Dioscorea zingiberensis TaxID=325984 RepID=A0A9D5HH81_9LILI|nr:hypothetical protein J5N97_018002 [Dioscorea zingiberensis]
MPTIPRARSAPRFCSISPPPSYLSRFAGNGKKHQKPSQNYVSLEKEDWQDATCSVCMEFPHNAVLLLCSSHDKGCRPYMCGTSYRHSNCLEMFKKAYTKAMPSNETNMENPSLSLATASWPNCKKSEGIELACPLCRGQVKGWTVVEPARDYLNKKRRSCMHDNCSFMGTYKQLQKHVKVDHPRAKPRKVDPILEQKWTMMEHQREREDIISTIRASNPRSVVLGDYVIDFDGGSDSDDDEFGERERTYAARGGFNTNYFYLLLQEGAGSLLTRFSREGEVFDNMEDDGGTLLSIDDAPAVNPAARALLDEDEEFQQAFDESLLRSRRRRRRRSRGRSSSSVS